MTTKVTIVEVGPRDGLQSEDVFVPTATKIELVNMLSASGLPQIEVSSFVQPRVVPQLRDAAEVFTGIERRVGVRYAALVPNETGARRAVEANADQLSAFVSASEQHNRLNTNMTVAESMEALRAIARLAGYVGIPARAYIVTAFGCPFEGRVPPSRVVELALRLSEFGFQEIALGDTIGVANPSQVADLFGELRGRLRGVRLAGHFHNARGLGLANVLAALKEGVTIFDSSAGGVGGCPVPPDSAGNIPTEDLVNMLESMGMVTGVDIDGVIKSARFLERALGKKLPGLVKEVGPSWRIPYQGHTGCGPA